MAQHALTISHQWLCKHAACICKSQSIDLDFAILHHCVWLIEPAPEDVHLNCLLDPEHAHTHSHSCMSTASSRG